MAEFPSHQWAQALMDKLNSDEQYARIAHKWEGDILFIIEKDATLPEQIVFYFDLWHGKCRKIQVNPNLVECKAAFTLKAPYQNFLKVMLGEIQPMQALMTRRLFLQGNMAVLMKNVPTVLDFVRCAREVTDKFI